MSYMNLQWYYNYTGVTWYWYRIGCDKVVQGSICCRDGGAREDGARVWMISNGVAVVLSFGIWFRVHGSGGGSLFQADASCLSVHWSAWIARSRDRYHRFVILLRLWRGVKCDEEGLAGRRGCLRAWGKSAWKQSDHIRHRAQSVYRHTLSRSRWKDRFCLQTTEWLYLLTRLHVVWLPQRLMATRLVWPQYHGDSVSE